MEEVEDLWHAGASDVAEAGEFGLVAYDAVAEELVAVDRQAIQR